MRGVVQRAWDVSKKREQIFQLAERGRQLGLMLQINDGLEWLPMLVYVGNELELWANWPELHDAPEIVPTATVTATMPTAASGYANQVSQILAINQGQYSSLSTFTQKQIAMTLAQDWERNYWYQRWANQQYLKNR
jgi:hypothetical protein